MSEIGNLADLYSAVAAALPQRTSLICGEDRLSYAEIDARAAQVAHHLIAAGIEADEHVGVYMLNCTEYVEVLFGAFTARAVPVNVNYRYTGAELAYLFGDAGFAALVVEAEFAERAAQAALSCPALRHVIVVGDADGAVCWPHGVSVVSYDAAVRGRPRTRPVLERSGGDRFVIYTGGTTGMPKGVIWRHEDFYFSALSGGNHYGEPYRTVEELLAIAAAMPEMVFALAAPLMHGAGTYTMFTAMLTGGTVLLMRRFDAVQMLRAIETEHVLAVAAVGDAMVRPLVDELTEHPARYDLSSWKVLGSGGALLSQSVRDELAALVPELFIVNRFGASESGSDGTLERGADGKQRLAPMPHIAVLDENFRPVGPGGTGRVAKSGHVPLGYYNDPEKTAQTFPVVDGVRWAVLGDVAQIEEDGAIVVLGRGSMCINTGGEKVFPEEVEQALKAHPAVVDALVAGVADERFGERVGAVVELRRSTTVDVDALRDHCRTQLAGYKVPALIRFVDVVVRSPTGKADYRWARDELSAAR